MKCRIYRFGAEGLVFLLCLLVLSAAVPAQGLAQKKARGAGVAYVAPLKNKPEQILVRKAYVASYNKQTLQANWVGWRLTAAHVEGKVKRPQGGAFHEDTEVPRPRATPDDYKGVGWSRGHLCPAGDNKWDRDAMYDTFLLTNISPQSSKLNSGKWNQIEMKCRQWAKKYGEVYIVCGPIFYSKNPERIGRHKIPVPDAYFKVVMTLSGEPKGVGFIRKNYQSGRAEDYENSIAEVERITGLTFFPTLPKDVAKKVKSKAAKL